LLKTLGVATAAALACAALMAAEPRGGAGFSPPGPAARPEHGRGEASPSFYLQSDLDAFMSKVLARRDENWKKLQQYILDEREQIEIHGSDKRPIWGERREYSWFIKDGYFIRSPVKVNGVAISEADRRKAEDEYLGRAKDRDKQRKKDAAQGTSISVGSGGVTVEHPEPDPVTKDLDSFVRQSRQPEFIESAYFLRFKFEQGKYALVGREKFEGQDVLRIEYYPTRLFSHEQDKTAKQRARGQTTARDDEIDAAMEKMMNKVSLVTIWVEPKASQIVKYTFDNVNFDFLPAAWLVRVSDLKASMTMSQAFKDVWLPRDVDMYFAAMTALGALDFNYHLDYHDYRQASTSGRIKGPGGRP
jgi:hypothetical protein